MHKVKCTICGDTFDRDVEAWESTGNRRYAHLKCYKATNQARPASEIEYEELAEYIKKIFGKDYLSSKVARQIRDYRRDFNFTFTGMKKALQWWFEIKGKSKEESNEGIGILPYIYEDAHRYFYNIFLAKSANEEKAEQIGQVEVIEIEIAPPAVLRKQPKLFNFE